MKCRTGCNIFQYAGSTLICLGISLYLSCNGASAQSLSQAITNMSSATITVMGYNETGFMNTSAVSSVVFCLF